MSMYTSGRARRSLIDTIAFRIVSQLATVLGFVVLVRGMSKEDFGVFNLLYSFIPVVSTVASLGLEQTLRRYQPEYLSRGNAPAAAWLVRFVASARFGVNLIVLTVILLAWNHIAPLFKLAPYRAEFLILGLLILVHFQARILELSLAANMMQRFSVGAMALVAIVKLIAYSLLGSVGALTLENALLADTAGVAVAYAVMRWAYRRYVVTGGGSTLGRPDRAERRRLLRYGAFNNFNDAGTLFLDSKTDNFFIAAIIDPVSVGIYGFFTRLNEMAQNLLPARLFQNIIQPLFFAIPRSEASWRVPQYFSLLVNLNLAWHLPVLAYAIAFHAEIVRVIFGGKFIEYSWMLPVILGFATCNVVEWPVTLVAQYEEKAATMLLSKIFALYNIGALLLLIPALGVAGAAIASGSAQTMKYAFIWWRVRRLANWTNARTVVVTSLALWGGVLLLCQVIKQVASDWVLLRMAAGLLLVGVGVLVHLRGPAVSEDDRRILAAVLSGKEARVLRGLGILGFVPAGARKGDAR
jgi:O-antigen/teichoic acid export membrane protein